MSGYSETQRDEKNSVAELDEQKMYQNSFELSRSQYSELTKSCIDHSIDDMLQIYHMIIQFTFQQMKQKFAGRKLYVLYEKVLRCDPQTDHQIPKNVYPVFEPLFTFAESQILAISTTNVKLQMQKLVDQCLQNEIALRIAAEQQVQQLQNQLGRSEHNLQLAQGTIGMLWQKLELSRSNTDKMYLLAKETIEGKRKNQTLYKPDFFSIDKFQDNDTAVETVKTGGKFDQVVKNMKEQTVALETEKMQLLSQLAEMQLKVKSVPAAIKERDDLKFQIEKHRDMYDQLNSTFTQMTRDWQERQEENEKELALQKQKFEDMEANYKRQLEARENEIVDLQLRASEVERLRATLEEQSLLNETMAAQFSDIRKQLQGSEDENIKLQSQLNKTEERALNAEQEVYRLREELEKAQKPSSSQGMKRRDSQLRVPDSPSTSQQSQQSQQQQQSTLQKGQVEASEGDFKGFTQQEVLGAAQSLKQLFEEVTGCKSRLTMPQNKMSLKISEKQFRMDPDSRELLTANGINEDNIERIQYLFQNHPNIKEQGVQVNSVVTDVQQKAPIVTEKPPIAPTNNQRTIRKSETMVALSDKPKQQTTLRKVEIPDNPPISKQKSQKQIVDSKDSQKQPPQPLDSQRQPQQPQQLPQPLNRAPSKIKLNPSSNDLRAPPPSDITIQEERDDEIEKRQGEKLANESEKTNQNYGHIMAQLDTAQQLIAHAKEQSMITLDQFVDVGVQVSTGFDDIKHEEPDRNIKAYRAKEAANKYLGISGITIHYKPVETFDIPEVFQRLFNAAKDINVKKELYKKQYEDENKFYREKVLVAIRKSQVLKDNLQDVELGAPLANSLKGQSMLLIQSSNDKQRLVPLYELDGGVFETDQQKYLQPLKLSSHINQLKKATQQYQLQNHLLRMSANQVSVVSDAELVDILYEQGFERSGRQNKTQGMKRDFIMTSPNQQYEQK